MMSASRTNEDRNREESERLEGIVLNWIIAAAVFVLTGVALAYNRKIGKAVSLLMFSISVFLLLLISFEYKSEKDALSKEGILLNPRVDILVFSLYAAIAIILWFMYEEASDML